MRNLINVTDLTDNEFAALLSGNFGASDVETKAGAHAFVQAAEYAVRKPGVRMMDGWLTGFRRECLDAAGVVNPAHNAARALKSGADRSERAIMARDERDESRWT